MILDVRLKDMLDIEKWQKIQDAVANQTEMSVITCDYKGIPLTKHSNMSEFCKAVYNVSEGKKMCQRCASVGGYEAFRSGECFCFSCHQKLANIAVPMIVDDNYLGYIIIGGVKIKSDEGTEYEELCGNIPAESIKVPNCEKLKAEIPEKSSALLKKSATFLETVSDCIISEKYELIKENHTRHQNNHVEEKPLERIEPQDDNPKYMINMLFPAFDYIAIHFRENISLQFIADMCHVSPSYFSRMFAKETRENFSTYIMKLRISYAKQQISTTEKSIAEIGFDSGFGDSSHFIKSFKKIEGITPLQYRKRIR